MPRERIPTVDLDHHPQPDGSVLTEPVPLEFQVTWGNDRADVRIGTTTQHGKALAWQLFGHDRGLFALGQMVQSIAVPVVGDGGHPHTSEQQEAFDQQIVDLCVQLGRDLLNAIDVEFGAIDGAYVGLDRRSVNAAIKLLRRARDGSFGKDE